MLGENWQIWKILYLIRLPRITPARLTCCLCIKPGFGRQGMNGNGIHHTGHPMARTRTMSMSMTLIIDLRSGAFEKNGKRKPSKQLLSNAVARAPGRVRYFLGRLLITSNYFLRKFCLVLINNLGKLLGQTASASGQTFPKERKTPPDSETPLTLIILNEFYKVQSVHWHPSEIISMISFHYKKRYLLSRM